MTALLDRIASTTARMMGRTASVTRWRNEPARLDAWRAQCGALVLRIGRLELTLDAAH